MVQTLADEFAAEVTELCAMPVSPGHWGRFVDARVPTTDPRTGAALAGRALTDNKQTVLDGLYRRDPRVAPWAGTAHGVLQAVNTYDTHEGTVRGGSRVERNGLKTITGDFGRLDRNTWRTLQAVLA